MRRPPTRHIRIMVQTFVFFLWVALVLSTKHPINSWISQILPVSLLLRIDPLVMTVVMGGMRTLVTISLLGFVTLGVSLLLGRVFCGWVCPLGAIFDAYGWVLRRFQVPIFGPSPWYFRFKYYLLSAILVFAIFGGVSPLMGFDPIVLVTRTFATVLNPFLLRGKDFLWTIESPPKFYGYFVDLATLILFMGIMSATTRLSRIWCRTACPLGAYLAVASRNSVLRRETKDCIHCNLCATYCPTGAISFENEEFYTESECIKCFSCSQECPVDANYFTFKSPIPAFTPSQAPVSLDRRSLFATIMGSIALIPGLRLSGGDPGSKKKLIRPPMSREERDFLSSCIRCTECIKACPSGILKPAGLEFGIRSLWTPVMVATEGACQEGCNACSVACPTDAILKYAIDQKYSYKSGTAVFNSSQCVSYTEDKFCSECVRACPTKAIEYTSGWEPKGGIFNSSGSDAKAPEGKTPTRPTHISYDKCVGCGACEFVCNQIVFGTPAMITTSEGRAVPTKL